MTENPELATQLGISAAIGSEPHLSSREAAEADINATNANRR